MKDIILIVFWVIFVGFILWLMIRPASRSNQVRFPDTRKSPTVTNQPPQSYNKPPKFPAVSNQPPQYEDKPSNFPIVTDPSPQFDTKLAKWYGVGQCISLMGYSIKGGMVYFGETLPDFRGFNDDACLIYPRYQVSPAEPWEGRNEMEYYPRYANLSPRCRGAYLKWLADGRSEPSAYIGYVFLFFYGLERRLLVDGQKKFIPEEERTAIVQEVIRLLEIYGKNKSFYRYANALLHIEWVLYRRDAPELPDYLDFGGKYYLCTLQVVLAKYAESEMPIPPDIALLWVKSRPAFGIKEKVQRCWEESRPLFAELYNEKYGKGIIIKPPDIPLKVEYHAASRSIENNLIFEIPNLTNPYVLTSPLEEIESLVKECIKRRTIFGSVTKSVAKKGFHLDADKIRECEEKSQLFESLFTEKDDVTEEQIDPSKIQTAQNFSSPPTLADSLVPKGFHLDADKIRDCEEESQRTDELIGNFLGNQEEIVFEKEMNNSDVFESEPLDALDKPHQDVLHRLIQREMWELNSFETLCKEYKLMPNAVREEINEWSLGIKEEPIIEDEDPISINVVLAKEIINGN